MRFEKVNLEQFKKDYEKITGMIPSDDVYNTIKIPTRATKGSAGYDFRSTRLFALDTNEDILIPTGIRWISDNDRQLLEMHMRSSIGFKYQIMLANTVGIIDADYYLSDNEGHIMIKLVNRGKKVWTCDFNDRICQGIIKQYFVIDDDNVQDIRNGGFSSTGKQ